MKGFIFDYGGTLDTLSDPVMFLKDVRNKYPEHKIILYTGSTPGMIQALHPGLEELVDYSISKPDDLRDSFRGLEVDFEELTYFDDDLNMLKASERAFKGKCICRGPKDLLRLLY